MRVLVIGDSMVSGENNGGRSFADYLEPHEVTKMGVSGTTVGEYSPYPVDGHSLVSQLNANRDKVAWAEVIILCYGVNDASALAIGYARQIDITVGHVKALDLIHQVNPSAKVVQILLTQHTHVTHKYARLHAAYLNGYYDDPVTTEDLWAKAYAYVRATFSRHVDGVVYTAPALWWLDRHLTSDNIHIDDDGHKELANVIKYTLENIL